MDRIEAIIQLKKERRAVILAHNYQPPEIQDIADYVGDSPGLSIQAARTDAEVIVFCGVNFMAETAKIISPGKTVLIPDSEAGCPMADMIAADDLRRLKARHPGATVMCYMNTTAAGKAECDLCCTSGNAERMVRRALPADGEVIFVPDRYLAHWIGENPGKRFYPAAEHAVCPNMKRTTLEKVLRTLQELSPVVDVPEETRRRAFRSIERMLAY
jgi:quinolinate synthase